MQGDSAEPIEDPQLKTWLPQLWNCLWRGALGGTLGTIMVLAYGIYKIHMRSWPGRPLLIFVGLGSAHGSFIGLLVWLFSRFRRTRLSWGARILLGTIVTEASIATYLYLQEGIGDTPGSVHSLLGLAWSSSRRISGCYVGHELKMPNR
jgi:hypothetical protein